MRLEGSPRLKSTIQFYPLDDKVFFVSTGLALKFDDPTGFLASVCQTLDGKKDINAIENELKVKHPEQTQYLADSLSALDKAKLIENAQVKPTPGLNHYDLQRWSKNIEFFGTFASYETNKFESQECLKNVKITLLGLGGLGSHILYDLAALGIRHIRAVDFDKVELSSLNRQILYSESDVELKTQAAERRIKKFSPKGKFEFINKKLESQKDVENVVAGSDFVICVTDKRQKNMQSWLNQSCVKHNITYIDGWLDTKKATLFSVIPGISGCTECWKQHVVRQDSIASILNEIELQKGEQRLLAPTIVPFVSALTGFMLTELIKMITGISTVQTTNKLTTFDFESLRINAIETWGKQIDCKTCSGIKLNKFKVNSVAYGTAAAFIQRLGNKFINKQSYLAL